MNKAKQKGTQFETAVKRYLQERFAEYRIDRLALQGNLDCGDIGIFKNDRTVAIIECKNYKKYYPSDIAKWRAETIQEMNNARTNRAFLVVKIFGQSIEKSLVYEFSGNEFDIAEREFELHKIEIKEK